MAFFQAAKCKVGLDAAFIFTLHNAKQIASFGAGRLPLTVEQMLWFEMNGLSVEPVLVDDDLVYKLDLVATNLAVFFVCLAIYAGFNQAHGRRDCRGQGFHAQSDGVSGIHS